MDKAKKTSKQKASSKAVPAPNQQQAADYIAGVSLELSEMAAQADLPFLKYLLDMTTEEAMRPCSRAGMPRRRH